jgi:putative endonuclease
MVNKVVWFEPHSSIRAAISREKQIKAWARLKKVYLIEEHDPTWRDLRKS